MKLIEIKATLEVSESKIQYFVEKMAHAVAQDVRQCGEEELVMVVVLKGGLFFAADLARAMLRDFAPPMRMLFVTADSYRYEMEPGDFIHIDYPQNFQEDIAGKYVLVVDDISGSGRTLKRIVHNLRGISKVTRTATMLWHPPDAPDFFGVTVHNPDLFAIGYGMDWKGMYRNDPIIRLYTKEQLKQLEQ